MDSSTEEIKEEARRQIQAKIDALEGELELYEDDFVKLTNAEDSLAKLYVACEGTSSAVSSVGYTLNEIYDLGTSDKVPGFERLFSNFGEEISSEVMDVNATNNQCISELETTGQQIDAAQSKVAAEIRRLVYEIDFYKKSLASI